MVNTISLTFLCNPTASRRFFFNTTFNHKQQASFTHSSVRAIRKRTSTMSTDPCTMKTCLWTSYEVTWTPKPDDFLGLTRDFWLTQHIEDWLMALVHLNTDDLMKIDKEWWIFHITPGHAFIFLHLVVSDLQPRIQTPIKLPACGWSHSPLPSSSCTETCYPSYWDFHVKLQELRLRPVFSESHQRIVHRTANQN